MWKQVENEEEKRKKEDVLCDVPGHLLAFPVMIRANIKSLVS